MKTEEAPQEPRPPLTRCQGIKAKDGRPCRKPLGRFWPGTKAEIRCPYCNYDNPIIIPAPQAA